MSKPPPDPRDALAFRLGRLPSGMASIGFGRQAPERVKVGAGFTFSKSNYSRPKWRPRATLKGTSRGLDGR
jgi:hypothetical protein